ncbi:hypothetical protein ACP25C_13425 [Cronobacter turicensis]|jgi:hypothetical protein
MNGALVIPNLMCINFYALKLNKKRASVWLTRLFGEAVFWRDGGITPAL